MFRVWGHVRFLFCVFLVGFGVSVDRVSDLTGLELILRKPVNGFEVVVIEVPSREVNAQILKEITQRVSSAVRIGINLA